MKPVLLGVLSMLLGGISLGFAVRLNSPLPIGVSITALLFATMVTWRAMR